MSDLHSPCRGGRECVYYVLLHCPDLREMREQVLRQPGRVVHPMCETVGGNLCRTPPIFRRGWSPMGMRRRVADEVVWKAGAVEAEVDTEPFVGLDLKAYDGLDLDALEEVQIGAVGPSLLIGRFDLEQAVFC